MTDLDPIGLVLTLVATVAFAPLLQGVIRSTKAFWQGRRGPPTFQAYADLGKLARKGAVIPEPASWVFQLAPALVLSVTLVAVSVRTSTGSEKRTPMISVASTPVAPLGGMTWFTTGAMVSAGPGA